MRFGSIEGSCVSSAKSIGSLVFFFFSLSQPLWGADALGPGSMAHHDEEKSQQSERIATAGGS